MKVTAALAWFDEELSDLDRCVRSLPIAADRLVAVDGGYSRYPGAKASSPKEQAAHIKETARAVGLSCEVLVPSRIWVGQVEKRSYLLGEAIKDADWVVVVDADHVLHGQRVPLRRELAGLEDEDAVEVDFWTPANDNRPISESAAGGWHEHLSGRTTKTTAFFRALPGLRVERYHWWHTAEKDDRRVALWGGDGAYPKGQTHTLRSPFVIEHRCLFRKTKQIVANRRYCADRERRAAQTGYEDPSELPAVPA